MWAGLADAIVKQITDRLSIKERELFFFRLQLSRLDHQKIRQAIYNLIFNEWLKYVRPLISIVIITIVSFVGLGVTGWIGNNPLLPNIGLGGAILTSIVGIFGIIRQYAKAEADVMEKPAKIALGQYLNILIIIQIWVLFIM